MLFLKSNRAKTVGYKTKNFFLEINIQTLRCHHEEFKIELEKYTTQPKQQSQKRG